MSDINFIDYDKISIHSDAFVSSDELNCYFQYIPSTKTLSVNVKKEKHTAGTTDDPNDYKIPDIKEKLSPKKLYRINPFHRNFAEELHLHKTNTDPEILYPTITKEVKVVDTDYSSMGLNQDQIDFLIALKNLKNLKVEDVSKKLDIDQFEVTEEKLMDGFFQLYPRFMEQLVSTSGNLGNLNYEEEQPEESFGYTDSEKSMLDYHLQQMGLNKNDLKVKKNFQVRTGNVKEKNVTPYLQDVSNYNSFQNKLSNVNNVTNINSLNISSNNKIELSQRQSSTNFYTENKSISVLETINHTKKISNYHNVRIKKDGEKYQEDFKNIFEQLLKDVNLRNDVTNFFNKSINLHSRNINFEFLSQINQSNAKNYITNLRNQTSVYNFYRSIENRYKEFIQNLNFMNEIYQEFKSTEFKIRNSYQNIYQHNHLQKNLINKNIINLTKEINFENNLVDFKFQSAILKTISKSNNFIHNKIEKITENLNVISNNIDYVNQRVSVLNYKTENRIDRQIRNVLNNSETTSDYSNIIVNKLSNIVNNSEIKKLLSIVKSEQVLESLAFIIRESNFDTSNIKQINEIINLTKNSNFQSLKFSTESISNIKNLISLTESLSKNYNINEFKKVETNIDIISKKNFFRTSEISNINQISNVIKEISNISSNENKIGSLIKISKIENTSLLEQLSLINDTQVNKNIKEIKKIRNIQNLNEITENFSLLNQTVNEKKMDLKIANNSQINKFIELLQNTKIDSKQITELQKLESKNITNILKVVNSISPINIQKISYISEDTISLNNLQQVQNIYKTISNLDTNNINKINNVINKISVIKEKNEISNINLTKNDISNVTKLETQLRTYSEKIKVKETLKTLDLVDSVSKINTFATIRNSYNDIQKISEVFENINIVKNNKNLSFVNRYSFESNKNNITNLFTELNITSLIRSEKKTERTFSSLNKQIEKLYKMNEKIERKASRAEQSFYDLINFNDYSVTSKTSTKKEIKNFFQTLNLVRNSSEQIKEKIKETSKTNLLRISESNEKVKIDIHRQKSQNYFKVENITNFEKKSYFQEKQEKEAQEKVIESKVEELLVKKIQNVTNNITNNVITKQEINIIKQEIIREIFKIEEKYDQKILAIKQETKQTVQNMLSQFLKS